MIEGAIILILGMAIGGIIAYFYTRKTHEESEEQPYDKYKNKDGLYSRKAVKESR